MPRRGSPFSIGQPDPSPLRDRVNHSSWSERFTPSQQSFPVLSDDIERSMLRNYGIEDPSAQQMPNLTFLRYHTCQGSMQNDPELEFASDQPSANALVQLQEVNNLIGERRRYVVKQVKVRVAREIPLRRGNAQQLQVI
jgi:hypothetical protein